MKDPKQQLIKTDNFIFIIISVFLGDSVILGLINWLLEDNIAVMNFFKFSPQAYANLSNTIQAILGFILIGLFVFLYILFKKHFKLLKELRHKGEDPLAARLRIFLENFVKNNSDMS